MRWIQEGIDFRFKDCADLVLWSDYSLRSIACLDPLICPEVILWSGGNSWGGTFVCPFVTVEAPSGVTTGSNQMLKEKQHTQCYLFCTCFLFFYFLIVLIHDEM